MKLFLRIVVCTWLLLQSATASTEWLTDYEAALKKSAADGKKILINFTGSDWCPACIRLKREVFDTAEFKKFAAENLILLEIDFPRKKRQSPEEFVQNYKLSKEFKIDGYPTVYVIDKDAKKLMLLEYRGGGPVSYIRSLKKVTTPAKS